jgi:hypothetical protein
MYIGAMKESLNCKEIVKKIVILHQQEPEMMKTMISQNILMASHFYQNVRSQRWIIW